MTKFELPTTIAILLFVVSAHLGIVVEGLATEDPIITDWPIKGRINDWLKEEEVQFCLNRPFWAGFGYKCIEEVNQALVFGFATNKKLGLQCCQSVLEANQAHKWCWDVIFGRQGKIQIDTTGLLEFCAQDILADLAPRPAPRLRA